MNTPCIKSTSLHFREGASDKVYQITIEPRDDGYIVTLQQAHAIHDKLVASKVAKGYKLDGEPTTTIRPQDKLRVFEQRQGGRRERRQHRRWGQRHPMALQRC